MLIDFDALVAGAKSGQLVSFPTDTVPALAVRPDCAGLIFQAKQRTQDKPLILMAATAQSLWQFVDGSLRDREIWEQVAEKYWPGALTLVLPCSKNVPQGVNQADPSTIGLRVPNHAIALAILSQTGALATTSVNRSGEPPLQTITEIETHFPDVLTLLPSELETIQPSLGMPSTVAKWSDTGWQILRQGAINLDDTVGYYKF
ncbi:SUA5/yciO/yrdC domain protein [Crinalium epipsammum PCC 9333]|uniref:L-threonylcarbamoyladenylate synthase n=1 Tax=Crinalium epipsammum PCC 9333 TaxID=1173022 RepID=K9W1J1_9CYAN|nr:L-threonylcarbamoyladenylate synthase [Crinalium epipsammum]AFZ13305.1 SUA5/yciO/yrdC domain protein [Crinalium epipsammum PCC 9333]